MTRLLWRASLRYLGRHPVLTALSIVGIALGVAVVVAIDLANGSAMRAFALSTEGVSGRATDHVLGGPAGVDEALYVRLRRELGALAAAPIVEGFVSVRGQPGRAFRVLGVDPFAESPFRPYVASSAAAGAPSLLASSSAVVIARRLAERLGIERGGAITVSVGGRDARLDVVALLDARGSDTAAALDDLLLVDIATAQEVLHRVGRLSRIDLAIPSNEAGATLRASVAQLCAERCSVVPASQSAETTRQMTRAFALNLSALSLLALLVGMFLIYSTITFSVVQRRPLLGTLRALGVRRGEVFQLILGEALALAIPATALGLVAGVVLASQLVKLVTRTINDLYFVVNVQALAIDAVTLSKGAALGIGATLLAAAAPAWEATRVAPAITMRRSEVEARLASRGGRLAGAGAALAVLAALVLTLSRRSLVLSYVGLFGVLLAFALLVPSLIRALSAGARPVLGAMFGTIGRMAARGIVTSLSRTSVALAALAIAIATTVGVGVMVHSFRNTVVTWLGTTLQSDVFISPPTEISRKSEGTLLPGVVERLATTPGVTAVNTVRNRRVRTALGEVDLHVPDSTGRGHPYQFRGRGLSTVDREEVRRLLREPRTVAVSEPFAFHHGIDVGASLDIATDRGTASFRVVGIYGDYASDEGGLLMSLPVYLSDFEDRGVSAMGVVAEPGADLDQLRERLRIRAGDEQALTLRANRELRELSMAIFDRTFAITRVLRMLAVGVAFVGVLSALMALALERARELAVLRAMGMTPRQVVFLVTLQTALLGAFAGVLAVPLGLVLAYILVFVINQRSFGWSLELHVPLGILLEALALALGAALLAGLYPSWKMSRQSAARALREE